MRLYRNVSKRGARGLFVSYSLGEPEPMNERTFVSRVVFPEELINNTLYAGWHENERLFDERLTYELDVFYSVINNMAFDVAQMSTIQEAILKQLAAEPIEYSTKWIRRNCTNYRFLILRFLVNIYGLRPNEVVFEGFTVGDFLSFFRNVQPVDFWLPSYPTD